MKKLLSGIVLVALVSTSSIFAQDRDLIIQNGELEIGGTLTTPTGKAEKPLVILITGSGAQDRDQTIFGFKPFKIIADHLSEQGISSFRYDDRQIGSSTGDFAESTLSDLSDDVTQIMGYFQFQSETIFDDFILLGHSQGGVVASKVAARDARVVGVILMASTIVLLKDVINEQVTIMQKASGKSDEDIQYVLDFQEMAYEVARKNEGWENLKTEFQKLVEREVANLSETQRQYIVDIEAFAQAQFNAQITPFQTPQMRSLLHHDPAGDLNGLEAPILALFGEKDTQVTPSQNETALNEICLNDLMNCEIQTFKDANHLFQSSNTGFVTEYATLPKEFVDGFLSTISGWVLVRN